MYTGTAVAHRRKLKGGGGGGDEDEGAFCAADPCAGSTASILKKRTCSCTSVPASDKGVDRDENGGTAFT